MSNFYNNLSNDVYLQFICLFLLYNKDKNRGELMYTVYLIFAVVLILSFITGNIVLLVEHKRKNKKLIFTSGSLVDEELL